MGMSGPPGTGRVRSPGAARGGALTGLPAAPRMRWTVRGLCVAMKGETGGLRKGNAMRITVRVLLTALTLALCAAEAGGVPNDSFERGRDTPEGWRLEGAGNWERGPGGRWVAVTGTGDDSSFWRTTDHRLEPNALYRMSFRASGDAATGGCLIAGPSFCNRDFRPEAGWHEHGLVFATPDARQVADAYVRVGQWHVIGQVGFDDVRLLPTQPVHRRKGDLQLGEGEVIEGRSYAFEAPFRSEGCNYSRPLHSFTAGFNSNRWTFAAGSEVVYRHGIPGALQRSVSVEVNCNYHVQGGGVIEASTDAANWVRLAAFDGVMPVQAEVPPALLPAETVYVRLRSTGGDEAAGGPPGSFQLNRYRYSAELDADAGDMIGGTVYPEVQQPGEGVGVSILSGPGPAGLADDVCRLKVANLRAEPRQLSAVATVTAEDGTASRSERAFSLAPRGQTEVLVPCVLRRAGRNAIDLAVLEGDASLFGARMELYVPGLHDAAFGYALPADGPVELWWCEGTHKVSRQRPAPSETRPTIEVEAAGNEYEPVQLVLRPSKDLIDVWVEVSDLSGPDAVLSAGNIDVAQVAYVRVTHPTDSAGAPGWWPDPLPPYEPGRTLEAGVNHPFWITVHVPEGQPAGLYTGSVTLSAEGWRASVPMRLRVWDFALPRQTHLQTAFGLSAGTIRRFHNLETTEELRQVLDLYHRDFAAHRIAPYSPAPLGPIRVEFPAVSWKGGAYDAAEPRSGGRCFRVVDADPAGSVAGYSAEPIPVDPACEYRFSWWARTQEPSQTYLVTVQQYDGAGQWIPYYNVDVRRTGNGRWQREGITIPGPDGRLNERTRSVRIHLRPARWTEGGEAVGTAWFDDLEFSRAGDAANLVRCPGFELEAESLRAELDFTAFDAQCRKCLDGLGLNTLMVRLQGMPGGTFHARREGRLDPFAQGTPEYERLMASQGRQIVEHLRENGWLDEAYVYWFDEPAPRDYEFVIEGMNLLKRAAPGLTRMLTEQPEPALFGHVDLWCPVVSAVAPEAIRERKQHGGRFWWYLCTGPKAPYIGLFIDRPATDLRVWAWLSRKWGVEGQLVWSSNYWTSAAAFPPPDVQNPWVDPMAYVSGYSFERGQIGYWGNGDGRFLYPPTRDVKNDEAKYLCGPVDSIRWEMLREGIEDYEYFCVLDALIEAAEAKGVDVNLVARARELAAVPDSVIKDDRTYSKDPGPLYEHRRRVAEAIEQLSRALPQAN